MLGDECGVVTHRGLLPVVGRVGGGDTLAYEDAGMLHDRAYALFPEIAKEFLSWRSQHGEVSQGTVA